MRCSNENLPALAIGDVVIIKGEERDIYGALELLLNFSKERIESCVLLNSIVEDQN